jgi:hypothetical protein
MALDSVSAQASTASLEILAASAYRRLERLGRSLGLAFRSFRGPELPNEIDLKDLGYPASLSGRF